MAMSNRSVPYHLAVSYLMHGMTLHRLLEIRELTKIDPITGLVVEIGEGVKPGPDWVHLPKNGRLVRYSIDLNARRQPSVVGDVTALPLKNSFADVVLMLNVLEHVRAPQQALCEVRRCLKPNGRLIISVPFLYRIHDTVDYFRYTNEGLRMLLRDAGFAVCQIVPYGLSRLLAAFSIGDSILRPTFVRRMLRVAAYSFYLLTARRNPRSEVLLPMGYIVQAH